jgi:hypothetical protein
MKDKVIIACLVVIFFYPYILNPNPKDSVWCKEDIWIKKIEKSKLKIIASSTLPSNDKYSYDVENLFDHNKNFCWCPGNKGKNGIDEFVIFKIPFGIKGIKIINGVAKNRNLYQSNNRVKKIYMGFLAKSFDQYSICENKNEYEIVYQTIEKNYVKLGDSLEGHNIFFSSLSNFSWDDVIFKHKENIYLMIGIIDIYKGTKYNDTCISEIEIIK